MVVNLVESRRQISRFRKVFKGQLFRSGEVIRLGEDSYLEIILFNNRVIRLYPKTQIHLKSLNEKNLLIELKRGKIAVLVTDESDLNLKFNYQIITPRLNIKSQTPSDQFIVESPSQGQDETIVVEQGSLLIETRRKPPESIFLHTGTTIIFSKSPSIDDATVRNMKAGDLPKKEDDVFDQNDPLETYTPEFQVEHPKDPWFDKPKSTADRNETIRHFRNSKVFYFQWDLGTHYITDQFYFSFNLKPRINLNDLKVQFRILAYQPFSDPLNPRKWYNYSEWDFKSPGDAVDDILSKIDYIRYTDRKRKVKIEFGALTEKTMGHGLLVNRYNNQIQAPQSRLFGLNYHIDLQTFVIDGFMAHLSRGKIFGFRVETQPIQIFQDGAYDQFKFGLTFSMDLDPQRDGGNPQVFLGSIDLNIPLLNNIKKDVQLSIYSELAIQGFDFNKQTEADASGVTANKLQFIEKSFGVSLGMKGRILQVMKYRIEYRFLAKGFIPEYFNSFYEIQRKDKVNLLLASNKGDFNGVLLGFGLSLKRIGKVYMEYYHETGEIAGLEKLRNRLHIEMTTSAWLSPTFTLRFRYDRENISSFKDLFQTFFGARSLVTGEIGYAISRNIDLSLGYTGFFESRNNGFGRSDKLTLSSLFIF